MAWWHCALSISLEASLKVRVNSLPHNSRLVQLDVTATGQGVGASPSTGEMWDLGLLVGLKSAALERHLGLWEWGKAWLFQKWNPQLSFPALLLLWSEQGHQGRAPDRSHSICISGLKELTGWWLCNIFWRYCTWSDLANSMLGKTRLIRLGCIFQLLGRWNEKIESSWSDTAAAGEDHEHRRCLQGPWTVSYVTITMTLERRSQTIHVFQLAPAHNLKPYLLFDSPCAASAACSQSGTGCSIKVHTPLDLQPPKASLNT